MRIIYKKITKKDILEINELLSKYVSPFKLKTGFNKVFKKFNLQKNNISIVASLNKKIIGYATIHFNMTIRGGVRAYIEDVVVEKKFRKKGIGKNLIKFLLKFAKKKNCYKIVLDSKIKNIKFYKTCGFKLNSFTMRKIIK